MPKIDKKILVAILLTILVLALIFGTYIVYKKYDNKRLNEYFNLGYNQSLKDVATFQTQNGNIIVWKDDVIQVISVPDICNYISPSNNSISE